MACWNPHGPPDTAPQASGGTVAEPTRRAMIAAAASLPLVAVSGCNGVELLASPPRPAPAGGLLQAAIAAEQMLVTQYAAVLRGLTSSGAGASATLTAALEPLLGQHRAHLAELRSRLIVPVGSASPSPSARATHAPVVPAAPAA